MNYLFRSGFTVLLFIFFTFCTSSQAANSSLATVIKVLDGDSMWLRTVKGKQEVRLYGVDCPERGQPYSNVARKHVNKWVRGKTVSFTPLYKGKYGRTISRVEVGGEELSEKLIRVGYAWVHPAYCHKSICRKWRKLERRARERRIGLWRDGSPVPPWKYKQYKRKKR